MRLTQDLLSSRNYSRLASTQSDERKNRTIETCVVRFNMNGLDLSVLNLKSVTLAAWTTEDRTAIEGKIQCFGVLCGWVA